MFLTIESSEPKSSINYHLKNSFCIRPL